MMQPNDEWTTVEMVDTSGNARYVLIKSNNESGASMDTAKILNVCETQTFYILKYLWEKFVDIFNVLTQKFKT